MEKIKSIIKLMRTKHYIKNLLIFLPLLASREILNLNKLICCLIGFISFSLIASSIYVINDLKDVDEDRNHPKKKNRPIASGKVSPKEAIILFIVLLVISFGLDFILYSFDLMSRRQLFLGIGLEILYLFLNILYSFGLKNIPILDIVILMSGFVIRLLYGASISNIIISNWLYLTIMAGAFYLGFGKRRNELIKNSDGNTRKSLKKYNKEFLDKFMYVNLVLAIVFYSLWCIDKTTISRVGNNYMIWTIPVLMIIIMKYSLDVESDSDGDPVEVILGDKILTFFILFFALMFTFILYFN